VHAGVKTIQAKSSKGILVLIEPDKDVRDALLTLLRGWGWTLDTVSEPHGLEVLLGRREVAAVISEASMPGCKASDVLQTCAQWHVPVIFTGHDLPAQDAVDLIRQGGYGYLEKPFQQERLLALLHQLSEGDGR